MLLIEIAKNGAFQGALVALLAVSFSLVYATTRVFHVALGAVYLCAGYTALFVGSAQMPLYVGVMAAVVCAVVANVVIDRCLYSVFTRANSSASLRLIGSLSVLIICMGVISWVLGNQIRLVPWFSDSSRELLGIVVTSSDVRYVLTALVCTGATAGMLALSGVGHRIRACASDPVLLEALGHDALSPRLAASCVGGVLIGIAAAYQTYRTGIDPTTAWPLTISAAVATIVGGRSLVWGPACAAIGIGFARSATTYFLSDLWSDSVVYVLLLIVMILNACSHTKLVQE